MRDEMMENQPKQKEVRSEKMIDHPIPEIKRIEN
jgi:hypothetical protein